MRSSYPSDDLFKNQITNNYCKTHLVRHYFRLRHFGIERGLDAAWRVSSLEIEPEAAENH